MASAIDRAPKPFCFNPGRRAVPVQALPVVTLAAGPAAALAKLVPLLGCGEEAAALAFTGLARRESDPALDLALRSIAAEERVHENLLLGLSAALPPCDTPSLQRAARRFHIDLGRGPDALHLARIAAVDAGVCTILSRLLAPGTPLAADRDVAALLTRIRRDESRHVRASRQIAIARAERRVLEDMAAAAREALANVIGLAADAFEVLHVDPARLIADLRVLPQGLLRT
jgi:rubrerythrin